jgi:hypothetical protein
MFNNYRVLVADNIKLKSQVQVLEERERIVDYKPLTIFSIQDVPYDFSLSSNKRIMCKKVISEIEDIDVYDSQYIPIHDILIVIDNASQISVYNVLTQEIEYSYINYNQITSVICLYDNKRIIFSDSKGEIRSMDVYSYDVDYDPIININSLIIQMIYINNGKEVLCLCKDSAQDSLFKLVLIDYKNNTLSSQSQISNINQKKILSFKTNDSNFIFFVNSHLEAIEKESFFKILNENLEFVDVKIYCEGMKLVDFLIVNNYIIILNSLITENYIKKKYSIEVYFYDSDKNDFVLFRKKQIIIDDPALPFQTLFSVGSNERIMLLLTHSLRGFDLKAMDFIKGFNLNENESEYLRNRSFYYLNNGNGFIIQKENGVFKLYG